VLKTVPLIDISKEKGIKQCVCHLKIQDTKESPKMLFLTEVTHAFPIKNKYYQRI